MIFIRDLENQLKKTAFIVLTLVFVSFLFGCNELNASTTNSLESISPSTVSDPIKVYFTCAGRQGCDAESVLTGLLGSINQAKTSIDIAMYNLNLNEIANALTAAEKRGVQVRLVTDGSNNDGEAMRRIKSAGIPVVARADGAGLMHDKVVIIDGKEVWTGSLNLTWSGVNDDNNNLVMIDSEKIAADYEKEFEEMFTQSRYGSESSSDTPYPQMIIGGVPVEVYFAPEDHVQSRLLELVKDAKTSVDFLAMTLTQDALSNALISDAERGIQVRGVFEEDNALADTGSDYTAMRQAGLDVLLDGNTGLMHHKVMIIDREIVVFGSYNFTSSAEKRNDENLVIVADAHLASQFEEEFERIYAIAKP